MKMTIKIAILFFFLIISSSWGIDSIIPLFKTNTEKNIQDEKGTLSVNKLDLEENDYELVYESLTSFHIPFINSVVIESLFGKEITFPEQVFLNDINPPPEL